MVLFASSIISVVLLSSCNNSSAASSERTTIARTFTLLKDNESLYIKTVGEEPDRFMNYQFSLDTDMYLDVVTRKTYTLNRFMDRFGLTDAYFYNGYWYTLTINIDRDEDFLGTRTENFSYEVSYLIQETNEAIAVRETFTGITTFDYAGGWTTRSYTKRLLLNNWFTETTLQAYLPDLYAKIDAGNSQTYYIDVTVPKVFQSQINLYNGFYYFSSVE
jgi:hypothetical protein